MPLSRRVKGRCKTAAAVREKKTEEEERVKEVRTPENGKGMLIKLIYVSIGSHFWLPYCFS